MSVNGTTNIRILNRTKDRLFHILKKGNDKDFGKKIKSYHVVELSLSYIGEKQIAKLQRDSMTEDDQEEFIFGEYIKKNGTISKGQFKRLLFKGELTEFIKTLDIEL